MSQGELLSKIKLTDSWSYQITNQLLIRWHHWIIYFRKSIKKSLVLHGGKNKFLPPFFWLTLFNLMSQSCRVSIFIKVEFLAQLGDCFCEKNKEKYKIFRSIIVALMHSVMREEIWCYRNKAVVRRKIWIVSCKLKSKYFHMWNLRIE